MLNRLYHNTDREIRFNRGETPHDMKTGAHAKYMHCRYGPCVIYEVSVSNLMGS